MNHKNEEDKKQLDKELEDHDFDGIKENNNPIPTWFNMLLYSSILFALVYMVYSHYLQDGQSLHREEQMSMAKKPESSNSSPFDFVQASKDPKILADAQNIYTTNCGSCHGQHGEGGVGPNLTDDFWIYGDTYQDVVKIIKEGEMSKGMPAWRILLGDKKINELVAYIASIQGTNPANAKKPEGKPGKLH